MQTSSRGIIEYTRPALKALPQRRPVQTRPPAVADGPLSPRPIGLTARLWSFPSLVAHWTHTSASRDWKTHERYLLALNDTLPQPHSTCRW
ncbi:hypothetical protein CONPUDRAFT_138916 [Coniophora puteana RWD-64-598 SS2]|uniref:Uncharacterized protein n=1 Tax=Coniophora puteana (strain RWD-64-598) TaxID=741705 RepID=A0A5M3MER6_CONPW|nr:uncharacterized protein CONPUDRAFT_138916 [Coniophora puteana RWD-64-598 SS2]EIW77643.1 hypothetical protein CONPUDRAFT_138916 [Coniophora puteana RWD-64-598 SS2]